MTRDDPAAFAPPPAFGPFRVLHQIGIGALGPVFRTYEPARDRLVAVKVFRLDVTPEQAGALADELARAADAGLFHPSIVEPIAAGVEGTVAYRAEEYVAAESLDVAIRHYAPAALDTALPFLKQLAGAIDFARTAGVGHGGLHLRDVFVTPDEARASGFGIVEALERTGLRAPVRRPYSAPERIAGAEWSTPADVFSLAAIAYELLAGRRPSGTGEQIAPLTGSSAGPHADAIRSVLALAMDDDPARRYPTALGFVSALEVAAHSGALTDGGIAMSGIAVVPESQTAVPQLQKDSNKFQIAADEETPEDDDIAAERDADTTYHRLLPDVEEPVAPTLFVDEDEAATDRASFNEAQGILNIGRGSLDEPAVSDNSPWDHDEGAPAPLGVPDPADLRIEPSSQMRSARLLTAEDDVVASPERPRSAMLPLAFILILGLFLGFAAGYAASGRVSAPPAATASAPAPSPQPAATQPPPAGQAFSEQTVAQRPAASPPARGGAVPPVPGDAPAATPPPSAVPPMRTTAGSIVIRSTPSGAGVTVNGKWRGRTPLTMKALKFGPYALRVVRPGFAVVRQDVTLSASQPTRTLSLQMERQTPPIAPADSRARPAARPPSVSPPIAATTGRRSVSGSPSAGTIYVDSRPRGAHVFIDGRPMGTTPVSIPDISIGAHVVRLELADHRVWATSTRVAGGQETRVTGSLELIR
jgi:serine/threonine protein kinase